MYYSTVSLITKGSEQLNIFITCSFIISHKFITIRFNYY